MRINDVIALVLIVGVGGIGYYFYIRQTSNDGDDEEEKIIKDIKKEEPRTIIPKNKDFKVPEFVEDFFDKPKGNILSGAQDIVNDVVKGGQQLIENIVKPFKPTTTIVPKNRDFKKPTLDRYFFDKDETSLDDLITDAFRGNPFKPYSGTKYRPYD